jgi:DNA repair photolyase
MSFPGKAIYNPSGKAGEYSYWACNFFKGCSNGCEYCYLKKGVLKKTLGGVENDMIPLN